MYSIICDARKGRALGINVLGLVDRGLSKRFWWTSNSPGILLRYLKKSAADYACGRLKKNNPRVVSSYTAEKLLEQQVKRMQDLRQDREQIAVEDEINQGWDAHKDTF